MKRVTVKLTSNREDIKWYLDDILKEMAEHDEINSYIVLTEGVKEQNENRID